MRTENNRNNNSVNQDNGITKQIAIGVLRNLKTMDIPVSTSEEQKPIFFWLKTKTEREIQAFMKTEDPCHTLARSYLEYLRQKNRNLKQRDSRLKKPSTTIKRKEEIYNDINLKEDTPYDSVRMKNVTMNNINLNESQIYFDSIFAKELNGTYQYILNNREQYTMETKSTPFKLKNIKAIESGDLFIPSPTNTTLNGEILKLEISEFSNISNREYPNTNYIFEYEVETFGSRFRLKPLKPFYKFGLYINELNSLTFKLYLQNLILTFPSVSKRATLTYANPIVFTSNGHGLITGDKISIYQYEGSLNLNTTYIVTVIGPNIFTINVNGLGATGLSQVNFYILKNKIEGNFTVYCL